MVELAAEAVPDLGCKEEAPAARAETRAAMAAAGAGLAVAMVLVVQPVWRLLTMARKWQWRIFV